MSEKFNRTDYDFGFSFVSDEEMKAKEAQLSQKLVETEKTSQEKLEQLKDAIMMFLNNMLKDPDKPWIYWPDREAKVKAFMDKIRKL
jgi:hypothetical protein